MAKLPDPYGEREVIVPRVNVVTADTGIAGRNASSALNIAAEARSSLVQSGARAVNSVIDTVVTERDKIDKALTQTAVARAVDLSTEVELGANGFRRKSGEQTISPTYLNDVKSTLKTGLGDIRATLPNDRARRAFDAESDRIQSNTLKNALLHSATSAEAYYKASDEAFISSQFSYIKADPTDPERVAAGVEGIRATVINSMARGGVTDPVLVDAGVRSVVGVAHANVITEALRRGEMDYAQKYYESNRADLTEEQDATLQPRIRELSTEAVGDATGSSAFDLLMSGAPPTAAEKFIIDNTSGAARAKANAVFDTLRLAREKELDRTEGSLMRAAFAGGLRVTTAGADSVLKSDAFAALPEERKVKLHNYITTEREQTLAAERAERNERQVRKTIDPDVKLSQFKTLNRLARDPNALAQLTDEDLDARLPELGYEGVARAYTLRDAARAEGEGAGVEKQYISAALKNVPEKDHDALQGAMLQELANWKARNPGRKPTGEEQKAIAKAGQDEFIDLTTLGGRILFGRKAPEYTVERGEGYPVTFEKLFPEEGHAFRLRKYQQYESFAAEKQRLLKSAGRPPATDDILLRAWTKSQSR